MKKASLVKNIHDCKKRQSGEMTYPADTQPQKSSPGSRDDMLEVAVQEWCNRKEAPLPDEEPSFLDSFATPLEKIQYILKNCFVWKQWRGR